MVNNCKLHKYNITQNSNRSVAVADSNFFAVIELIAVMIYWLNSVFAAKYRKIKLDAIHSQALTKINWPHNSQKTKISHRVHREHREKQISVYQRNQWFELSCKSGKSCQRNNKTEHSQKILFRQNNRIDGKYSFRKSTNITTENPQTNAL